MQKINFQDLPSTTTPIDADNLNDLQDNVENAIENNTNVKLLAVSSTAPAHCSTGDKYYNTTTKKIYTATGTDTWGTTGVDPTSNIIYIVFDDQSTYSWDGTNLVRVGGSDLTVHNSYSESATEPYSANYSNKAFGGDVVWTNPDTTASYSGTTITLNDTYSKIEILFKRSAGETNQFNLVVYNDNNNTIMTGVSSNLLCTRQVKLDGTSLQIANGFKYATYGSSATQENSVLIPYKVIGYK